MIKNAVFVLGAGASCPYGFPTGKDLRKEICSYHENDCGAYLEALKPGGVIWGHLTN